MEFLAAILFFSGDVRDLGSESFIKREKAQARLERWSPLAWPLLCRSFSDPEQQRRAHRILTQLQHREHYPLLAMISPATPMLKWKGGCWDYRQRQKYEHMTLSGVQRLPHSWYDLFLPTENQRPDEYGFLHPVCHREGGKKFLFALRRWGCSVWQVELICQFMLWREYYYSIHMQSGDIYYP